MTATGAPPEERFRVKVVDAEFDRPFGFIAVHRPSRLALVAGWVSSPFCSIEREKKDNPPSEQHHRLSIAEIEALKSKGYNQSQIAQMFNVSRQAVSWHMKTYGGRMTPRQIVNESWPWETTNAHGKAKPFQRLRDHGEFMLTKGRGMNANKLRLLHRWWHKLREENLVIEFDPGLPPKPGVSPHGGFAYRTRVSEDNDLLIRVNDHTKLTEEGKKLWCWPNDFE